MNTGWIKIHRKIEENDLWLKEPFSKAQAWIDLILLANHKPGTLTVRGNIISIERGQVGWAKESLAKRWKWSRNKVLRFLEYLEGQNQIIQVQKLIQELNGSTLSKTKQQKSRILGLITIINYEEYQKIDTTNDTTERQQKDNRRYIDKNEKNEKNNTPYSPPEGEVDKNQDLKQLIEYWNQINVNKKVKNDSVVIGQPIMKKCVRITEEIKKVYAQKRKNYSAEEIKRAIQKYAMEICNISPENDYKNFRFYFLDFIKRKGGLEKFITSVEQI